MVTNNTELLPISLQKIIAEINTQHDEITPRLISSIVVEAGVTSDDLMPWVDFAHPLTDSYGRKLVFESDLFEIMVMSWLPGDVSAIHDHGHTQWGAVQVFGSAEHATFLVQNDEINTLSRGRLQSGRVIAVGHELVHQMANTSEDSFLSLHIYGLSSPGSTHGAITSDARIWDLARGVIQYTNGGVFFALPEQQINAQESAPKPDYLSWIHNTIECLLRVKKARQESDNKHFSDLEQYLEKRLFDTASWGNFEQELLGKIDDSGHTTDSKYWKLLRHELTRTARLQRDILSQSNDEEDSFSTYAEIYDEVIGKQCLDFFTSKYIRFVYDNYDLDFAASTILSVGCGTGIMEEHIINTYNVKQERVLGIDNSPAMVEIAAKKINAKVQDILDVASVNEKWDICFASLNVYQYLPQAMMEKAIQNTASLVKSDGYFVGDFITPDHVRWYPNVIASESVISLRNPLLIEQHHNTCQQSEIINVSKLRGEMRVTYEGKHTRYLPSLWKVRHLFEKYFKGKVDIFDAVTLEPLLEDNDTSPSTRYLVVARK